MSKGMVTCKICGSDFALIAEEHYVARNPEEVGLAVAFGRKQEAEQYDAFDCPLCGCQNVIQMRKREVIPSEFKFPDEEDSQCNEDASGKELACDGCEHDDEDACSYPCAFCARTLTDYYKKKED